jgi:hypothetical protein
MPTNKKTTPLNKFKIKVPDIAPRKDAKGGRDPASGLPTGKRMHKPIGVQ